ncbi:hypothetical protein P7C70_g7839, partial [Phenoliferia sp. Uapishka_3]
LKERMLEKKALNAKKELEDQKANAAIQRKQGKDSAAIKAEMELKEAQKAAIERKADKLADLKAKNAVRAQIEADKIARAAKFAKEKALRDGKAPPITVEAPVAAPKPSTGAKATYDSARLQIRLPSGGQPLVTSLPSSSTLNDLVSSFSFETTSFLLLRVSDSSVSAQFLGELGEGTAIGRRTRFAGFRLCFPEVTIAHPDASITRILIHSRAGKLSAQQTTRRPLLNSVWYQGLFFFFELLLREGKEDEADFDLGCAAASASLMIQ